MKVSGSTLTIPAIKLPDGTMSKPSTLDLATWQGQTVRVYIDASGTVQINPPTDCYWQICELVLPPPRTAPAGQGTQDHTANAERTVTRSGKATDTIKLAASETIGRVGFGWAPYQTPADYNISGGVISWLSGHGPAKGDSYNIEIITATQLPNTAQQPVPLDISSINITSYTLPQ